jgi:hypothetical protein
VLRLTGHGWRVAGGGWRVAGGGWRVTGDWWRVMFDLFNKFELNQSVSQACTPDIGTHLRMQIFFFRG